MWRQSPHQFGLFRHSSDLQLVVKIVKLILMYQFYICILAKKESCN